MLKNYVIISAILGGSGVALGAFGAHGLQKITEDEKILHGFQTAVQYQMYHALALLAVALLSGKFPGQWIKRAGYFFIAGVILFSGSLYLLTFLKLQESGAVKWVGPITPVGGIGFILGWLCILLAVFRSK
ncbi:MAG: DUF423 domain-containing protein [Sphingobacteriales bacterium]|nr:DUF423 domain-containing protein [Sphingobacteriales bacterium]